MTNDISGIVYGLCIFSEYEIMSPIKEYVSPITKHTPDIPVFKDAPAYIYKAWSAVHEYEPGMKVIRCVLTAQGLPDKLVGEMVIQMDKEVSSLLMGVVVKKMLDGIIV